METYQLTQALWSKKLAKPYIQILRVTCMCKNCIHPSLNSLQGLKLSIVVHLCSGEGFLELVGVLLEDIWHDEAE